MLTPKALELLRQRFPRGADDLKEGITRRHLATLLTVEEVAPGTYEAPGDTKLTELERVTHFGIRDPRMTTIGGVAFRHLDRLPSRNWHRQSRHHISGC